MTLFITPYRTCCNCHHFKYTILANTICKSCRRISIAIARLIIKITTNIATSIAISSNISTTAAIAINTSRIFNITILAVMIITKAQPSPQCQSSVSQTSCRNHIGAIHDHHWLHIGMKYWSYWSHSSNHHSNHHFIFSLFVVLQLSFLFFHNYQHSYSKSYSCHEGHHVHRAMISRRCSCSSPLTWRQVLPARVERNWRHGFRVTFQLRDLLLRGHVPNSHGVVARACEEEGGDGQQLQNMNRNTVWIKFQDIFASKYFTSTSISDIATISSQARAVLHEQCNHKHIQMR